MPEAACLPRTATRGGWLPARHGAQADTAAEFSLANIAHSDYIKTTTCCAGVNNMPTAETYVRARIDARTKERATVALAAMGLSVSDAIRLLMLRIADERRLPFEVKAPNATTREAIAELEAGKGKKASSVEELMAQLNADD